MAGTDEGVSAWSDGDVDLALAVAAGPAYWGWTPSRPETVAAVVGQVGMVGVLGTAATRGLLDGDGPTLVTLGLIGAVWAATAGWTLLGLRTGRRLRSLAVLVVARVLLLVTVVGLWGAAHDGDLRLLELWPLGAAAGLEGMVTLRTIGVEVGPVDLLVRTAGSAVHLGVVVGLLALVWTGTAGITADAAVTLYVGAAVNVLAAAVAGATVTRIARSADDVRTTDLANEAAKRADWIHDEVCGMLLPIRQSIRAGSLVDPTGISQRLDELDLELRHAQLALAAQHHDLSVADLIQPWGRRIRSAGVQLVAPGWEVTRARLGSEEQYRLGRVLGVAVPNALAADAHRIVIDARVVVHAHPTGTRSTAHGDTLQVTVRDDAGGFDSSRLLPGHGLRRLMEEFGDLVDIASDEQGTAITTVLTGNAT